MFVGMKVKTSITLEDELLNRIDTVLLASESRSAFFANAARQLAQKRERAKRDERDIRLINANAEALNDEAVDNLAFVAEIFQVSGEEQP